MVLIDAHDSNERTFLASLQGVDLTKHGKRPGHSSNQTSTGLDAFMRQNFEEISKAAAG